MMETEALVSALHHEAERQRDSAAVTSDPDNYRVSLFIANALENVARALGGGH